MRIALIIEHFDPTGGGAEKYAVWLAGELARAGHEVHVVCHDVAKRINRYRQATQRASHDALRSHAAHHSDEEIDIQGVHIHKMRGMRLNSGLGFRAFGRRARLWCQQNKPDIIHSMSIAFPGDIYQPHTGVYAELQEQAIASRRSSSAASFKRLMLQFSGKQRTLLTLERKVARTHSAGGPLRILTLCPMITRHFQKHYHLDPASPQFFELPNPCMRLLTAEDIAQSRIDREWFRGHYGLATDDRVAVFVGHDFRRKGLRYAIETVAQTPSWKLLVVGLGKAREYVELANSLHVGDTAAGSRRVLFVGPTREMDKVYAAADALILPTFYDPFALVVLEALAHGLPVISTPFLGAAYLIQNHHVGAIVSGPRDIPAMASALESFPAAGTPEREALARKARAASVAMPPALYMEKLHSLYQQCTAELHRH